MKLKTNHFGCFQKQWVFPPNHPFLIGFSHHFHHPFWEFSRYFRKPPYFSICFFEIFCGTKTPRTVKQEMNIPNMYKTVLLLFVWCDIMSYLIKSYILKNNPISSIIMIDLHLRVQSKMMPRAHQLPPSFGVDIKILGVTLKIPMTSFRFCW